MRAVYPLGVTSGTQSTGPTPEIWSLCPVEAIDAGRVRGWHLWEDFINFPQFDATDSDLYQWSVVGDTGATIAQIADEVGGVLAIKADTANETAAIGTGGNTGGFLKLDGSHRVWFEARWKVDTIADTTFNVFVGLAEEGLVATDAIITAGGVFADKDYIGFVRFEADGDQCEPVFNKESGTDVVMEDSAKTLVADTYIKSGLIWDPTQRQEEYLSIFFDGTKEDQSDYDTKGSKANTIDDTTNFPGGEEMAVYIYNEAGATPGTVEIDWIKVAAMPL